MRAVPAAWRIRCVCLAALLLAAAPRAWALDPAKVPTQYVHNVWQTKDGLPQNTVTSIAQTPDGYLWLGTRAGLVRFDGVRLTVFDSDSTKALAQSQILSLLADREGRLWIGTWGGGLVRMEHGVFTRLSSAEGLPSELVSAIFEDRGGRLWVGTDGGGLARYDGARFVREPSRGALGDHVRAIDEDAGGLWVGTDAGLARLPAAGGLESFGPEQGLSRRSVRSLLRDRRGSLWVGTDLGLNEYRDGRFRALTRKDGLPSDVIVSLQQDRDDNLWIGTDGGGLARYRDGVVTTFTSRQGLSNDSVLSLREDREGSLWIGTNLGGLNRLRDGRVTPVSTTEGLGHDYVRAIYEDPHGTLWIGTEGGGLDRLRDGTITHFTTKDGLPNDTVFSILEDHEGSLWIGTDNGLARYRDGRFETFTANMGLSNDSVLSLYEDRNGALWIGTYAGGLNRYEDGRFTAFTTKEGLSHETVNVILEDRQGTLWVGTRGGGLNRYKDGRFTALTRRDGLSDDLVFSLYEDREGSLWIGTYGGGLSRLKNGHFATVTRRQGLLDDVVHRIIEDNSGHVWLSGNRGIARVSKKELDDVADGVRPSLVPMVFGTVDGMRDAECNGGANSGTLTRAGALWFPTVKGAVVIDPDHLRTNTVPPPVVIESALVDGHPVSSATAVRVPAAAQTLALEFTALSFLAPQAVRFRYRLEGLEATWIEADGRRTAYYSKLPPGQYRFHVIAANNDGVWNEDGATLAVGVQPRFHETWWFRAGVLVALGLAAAAFYRLRIRMLTRQKRELERVIAERTADLNAANDRLSQLARVDGLTGLLNRRAFDTVLDEECRRATRLSVPLSLLMLDVDDFKAYNDRYGHQRGDACLRSVASAIRSAQRRAGEVAARYGGEEMALILPNVSLDAATAMAEIVRRAVQERGVRRAWRARGPRGARGRRGRSALRRQAAGTEPGGSGAQAGSRGRLSGRSAGAVPRYDRVCITTRGAKRWTPKSP
jgi:diguanylate cyclase (GGDEF)-like protein